MCSFLVWKNACLNYREFDLEGDLVGVPHAYYLSADIIQATVSKKNISTYRGLAKNRLKGILLEWIRKKCFLGFFAHAFSKSSF